MSELHIERIGGIAGVGLPGSRIRSRGRVAIEQLPAKDRDAVDRLFDSKARAFNKSASSSADAFRYRLTRSTDKGTQTVDVGEEEVPTVLVRAVKDELI